MKHEDILQNLLNENDDVILASTAVKAGMSRAALSKLAKRGALERTGCGVYVVSGGIDDELFSLQKRAKKIVYSHETALFLHEMTDRTPARYSITVPSYYKPSPTVKDKCKVYYMKPALAGLGLTELPSGMGHQINAYNLERTICDVTRSRNKIDNQIFLDALKNYAARKDANLNLLADYARGMGVYRILRQYLEVLL
jgi:predicted transcriptional regulator of viral defense system